MPITLVVTFRWVAVCTNESLGIAGFPCCKYRIKVLTIPGSNIGFDMEQAPYDDDNGIWAGWGWSYLTLNHPRDFKFWMSFIETRDYQGPINGYVPRIFQLVDPEKISGGAFGETLEN